MATRKPKVTDVVEAPQPAPPAPAPEPYLVVQARAEFARVQAVDRAARIANCITRGHPREEFVQTDRGPFCPHCCTYPED